MSRPKAYQERLRAFAATATSWQQAWIRPWDSSASIKEFPKPYGGESRYIHIGNGHVACECCGTKRLKVLYAVVPDGDVSRVRFIGNDCLQHLIEMGAMSTERGQLVVLEPGPQVNFPDMPRKEEAMVVPELQTFDPVPFDPATAPIEVVWDWTCQHVPGLRESPGLGTPPNNKAGPLTYCEADLLYLLGQAIGITPVWYCASLSAVAAPEECIFIVDIYAGYVGGGTPHGIGEARCAWGDRERMPDKEARLRAAAALMLEQEKEAQEGEADAEVSQKVPGD